MSPPNKYFKSTLCPKRIRKGQIIMYKCFVVDESTGFKGTQTFLQNFSRYKFSLAFTVKYIFFILVIVAAFVF